METVKLIDIVKKVQQGDKDALQELYIESNKRVFFLAYRILKNHADAEDMTQEVFITVQEKIGELREPAAYYKWLNQITANKCASLLRKHKELTVFDDDEGNEIYELEDDDDFSLPEKLIEDDATRKIILSVIDGLPLNQRVCVMYYYYEELSVLQIAETLGISENTVKSRLSLARQKIRAAILEKEEKEGIRLHVLIPILPIMLEATDEFEMPEGAVNRMWENIQSSAPGDGSNNTPGSDAGTSGRIGPKSAEGNGPGGITNTGRAATGMKMALGTKILIAVISVVGVAALATLGAIYIPQMLSGGNSAVGGNNGSVAISGPVLADGFAEEHEVTLTVDGEKYTGTYEGEYAEGLFNGYGVWVCDSWRYEGNWENGVPNGEGSLFASAPVGWSNGTGIEVLEKTYTGTFADGLLHGKILIRYLTANTQVDHAHEWTVNYENGFATNTEAVQCNVCETQMRFGSDTPHKQKDSMGVPPWANMGVWWD